MTRHRISEEELAKSLEDDEAMSAEIDRHLTENPAVGEFHPGNPEVEVVVERDIG
jgi:hypothetical protein